MRLERGHTLTICYTGAPWKMKLNPKILRPLARAVYPPSGNDDYMRHFFKSFWIPEIARLNRYQRRELLTTATHAFRKEKRLLAEMPVILCVLGGVVGWCGLPAILAFAFGIDMESHLQTPLFWSTVGVTLGGGTGGWIGRQILYKRIRPYLKKLRTDNEVNEKCKK